MNTKNVYDFPKNTDVCKKENHCLIGGFFLHPESPPAYKQCHNLIWMITYLGIKTVVHLGILISTCKYKSQISVNFSIQFSIPLTSFTCTNYQRNKHLPCPLLMKWTKLNFLENLNNSFITSVFQMGEKIKQWSVFKIVKLFLRLQLSLFLHKQGKQKKQTRMSSICFLFMDGWSF